MSVLKGFSVPIFLPPGEPEGVRKLNGRTEWKDTKGRTLKQIQESEVQ